MSLFSSSCLDFTSGETEANSSDTIKIATIYSGIRIIPEVNKNVETEPIMMLNDGNLESARISYFS